VLGSLGIGAAPSIGVLLAQEVTRSQAWAGIARASVTIGAALLALPLGMLAARHGRRRALTLAWGSAAAGAALLVVAAWTTTIFVMVVGMMALGAGSAAGLQSRFAATDLAVPAHRARSLSLVVWVGTLGAVLGPNLGIPG
jgi:MFS family permease